ncbi:hypothetical protein ACFQH6_06090 [Halobacteriaceae archaeon GCM10025711]
MRRRTALQALAAGLAGATAGCVGGGSPADATTDPTRQVREAVSVQAQAISFEQLSTDGVALDVAVLVRNGSPLPVPVNRVDYTVEYPAADERLTFARGHRSGCEPVAVDDGSLADYLQNEGVPCGGSDGVVVAPGDERHVRLTCTPQTDAHRRVARRVVSAADDLVAVTVDGEATLLNGVVEKSFSQRRIVRVSD